MRWPYPRFAVWSWRRVTELADPILVARALGADSGRPLPGRRLRARVGAPGAWAFLEGGRLAANELAEALGSALGEAASILDFGCGAGRVLPWIATLAPQARCAGCDVDAGAIAWAARYLPQLRWRVSDFTPPLPFEADGFDLVYSISVLSHLDEPLQDLWLAELARVLRPGGTALLSVHGASAFDRFRSGEVSSSWCRAGAFERGPLGVEEFAFEPYVVSGWDRRELPGVGSGYGLAFHGEGYLRERWGRVFDVGQVRERGVSGWQDLVVCRLRS